MSVRRPGRIRLDAEREALAIFLEGSAARIRSGEETTADVFSCYGSRFDALMAEYCALEDWHDLLHPDRDDCHGVGGCPAMYRAGELERLLVSELNAWRTSR